MNKRPSHKQVQATVKAYVDVGIKGLVEVLNTFDNLWTNESCQGGSGELAFVHCEYGLNGTPPFNKMAEFTNKLATQFATHIQEGIEPTGYDVEFAIVWDGEKRYPYISIKLPPKSIRAVTNIFSLVRNELENNI